MLILGLGLEAQFCGLGFALDLVNIHVLCNVIKYEDYAYSTKMFKK